MMVAALLTLDQERERGMFAQDGAQKKDFLRRIVSADETWILHYTPKSKQ